MSEEFDELTGEARIEDDDMAKGFDKILPRPPAQAHVKPTRLTFKRRAGYTVVIKLKHHNKYHQLIFAAVAAATQTSWFYNLVEATKLNYYEHSKAFFDWLNESGYTTSGRTRYQCLKDYEEYRQNHTGMKHSPLKYLLPLLKHGSSSNELSEDDYLYLTRLIKLSKQAKAPESEPLTLTSWFGLPWLRSILGEQNYLSMESASRLLLSFRVTMATTLSHLLDVKSQWQRNLCMTQIDTSQHRSRDSNPLYIEQFGSFDALGEPTDDLTELLWLDMVAPRHQAELSEQIAKFGKQSLQKTSMYPSPWQNPCFFNLAYRDVPSPLEERLMSYLVACEAVQPNDIPKLKTTDYACEYNASGRLIAMQCSYYKGRAGATREPAMLMASDSWTKAQHAYLKGLPVSAPLFQTEVGRTAYLPSFNKSARWIHTPIKLLFKLWQRPPFQARIRSAMNRAAASPIFLDAALALTQGSENPQVWMHGNKKSLADYRKEVSRPIPTTLFSLTHIKTSAVHAGSDRYRDGDLINHHSHTSETEKHAYLTDANKDFVNRVGRITRLVLHDLQNVVYQPSVTVLENAVRDLELRSRLVNTTRLEDAQVHSLDSSLNRVEVDDLIIVPDTIEQAMFFLHTIAEAEDKYQQLLAVRPDWVERTLLAQVEWMSRTLQKMSSEAAARKQYVSLKSHLPPVFDHLLETHE